MNSTMPDETKVHVLHQAHDNMTTEQALNSARELGYDQVFIMGVKDHQFMTRASGGITPGNMLLWMEMLRMDILAPTLREILSRRPGGPQ